MLSSLKERAKEQNEKINIYFLDCGCFTVWLTSAVQQGESDTRIHISLLPWIFFPSQSPQSTEQGRLCSTVGSQQYFILL